MLRRFFIALLATVVSAPAATAGQTQPAHPAVTAVQAVRATTSVAIDGRLDDEVWLRAPAATAIHPARSRRRQTGHRTHRAADRLRRRRAVRRGPAARSRAGANRPTTRRGAISDAEADSFTIYLDPHHDHLTGACVLASPPPACNATRSIYNDTSQDDSWDAVWESAVTIDDTGWSVEMRIPFSQLRFPSADASDVGHQRDALHPAQERDSAWLVHVPKTEIGLASRIGHLEGLERHRAASHVEFLPYAVTRARVHASRRPGDPFNDGARAFAGMGVDLKYRLTSNLSLDATINPDFGQVEVDPAVVNLTAFETFFEEKRPFFIEGANIFSNFGQTGANNFWGFNRSEPIIFYSRRIGRAPQGSAERRLRRRADGVDHPRRGEADGQDAAAAGASACSTR